MIDLPYGVKIVVQLIFYGGKGCSTLLLNDNCLSNKYNNTCTISDSAFRDFTSDYELNNGNPLFSVSEFEVYEIN